MKILKNFVKAPLFSAIVGGNVPPNYFIFGNDFT